MNWSDLDLLVRLEEQRWVSLQDLVSKTFSLELNARDKNGNNSSWLQLLHPPDAASALNELSRSVEGPSAVFETDIFGSKWDMKHELGLLVPHHRCLSQLWYPAIQLMFQPENDPNSIMRLVVEGYAEHAGGGRVSHTGLLNQPFNFLLMRPQSTWLERWPSVMILPVMSCSAMLAWRGEAYEAIVIAADFGVYQDIGAVDGDV